MLTKYQRRSNSGFSLIELLVTIAILGLMALIVTPGVRDWKNDAELNADVRRLYGFFQQARIEAVKRNDDSNIIFNQVVNGTNFDYVSFIDINDSNTYDAGEEVIYSGTYTTGVTSTPFVGSFNRRGLISAATTIVLTGATGAQHQIVINTRGKMRIE